ncbi:MAG: hypothetical protein HY719_16045 [Planctomycetes bacterium]|nr:hypothetical protein [Planctomycetota bacterium]
MIELACPSCGKALRFKEADAGKGATCPACRQKLRVEAPIDGEAEPAAEEGAEGAPPETPDEAPAGEEAPDAPGSAPARAAAAKATRPVGRAGLGRRSGAGRAGAGRHGSRGEAPAQATSLVKGLAGGSAGMALIAAALFFLPWYTAVVGGCLSIQQTGFQASIGDYSVRFDNEQIAVASGMTAGKWYSKTEANAKTATLAAAQGTSADKKDEEPSADFPLLLIPLLAAGCAASAMLALLGKSPPRAMGTASAAMTGAALVVMIGYMFGGISAERKTKKDFETGMNEGLAQQRAQGMSREQAAQTEAMAKSMAKSMLNESHGFGWYATPVCLGLSLVLSIVQVAASGMAAAGAGRSRSARGGRGAGGRAGASGRLRPGRQADSDEDDSTAEPETGDPPPRSPKPRPRSSGRLRPRDSGRLR